MKKFTYILVGLVMLVALMMPSVVSAETIYLDNPGSEYDSGAEWHFVINQIDEEANAPSSITIYWSIGEPTDIPLDKFTGGVAHYSLDASEVPEGAYPTDGEALIYDGWDGRFNLSHGPTPPVPELPVIGLMGVGLAALGAFVFIKRKTLLTNLG